MNGRNSNTESKEKARILIVDDEKTNLDVLGGLLKPYYRTIVTKNGEQALKRLEKAPLPDLILLDVSMPGRNGYDICSEIKRNILTREIPVIFITSKTEEHNEAQGFNVGAVDYIVKPFSPVVTLARIKTHIELKERGDILKNYAIIDGLTGISNRRRFDEFLEYEWERSGRYQHPISLILLDIDFFKLFNDYYGHAQGDICIKQVARAIVNAMPRSVDLASRYGGEEFACILPETRAEGTLTVAERIRENCRTLEIPHANSKVANFVTLSIGTVTVVPTTKMLMTNLIEMADKALYRAKQSGRNQIRQFEKVME